MKVLHGLFFKSLVLVGIRILASACALVLTWLIANQSVDELGVFRTLFAYFAICEIMPLLGMQSYLIREISQHPGETRKYAFHALVFSLVVALVFSVGLCGVALFGGYSPQLREGLYVVAAGLPAMSASMVGVSILIGDGQAARYGVIQGSETLLRTALGIICILLGWGVLAAIAAMIVTRWLVLLGYWQAIRPLLSADSWRFDRKFFREFLQHVPIFAGITTMATVVRFAPQAMLPWMLNDMAAGQFAAAYVFIDIAMLGPTALMMNLGPVFARKAKESTTALFESCRQGIKMMALGVAPIAAIGAALARPIFAMVFPHNIAYATSARILEVIIWVCWLQTIDMVLAVTIVSKGEQHIDLQSNTVGAVSLVGLLAILVPQIGVMGAAVALLGGIVLQIGARFILVSRQRVGLRPLELVWRPVVAAAGATIIATVAGRSHWLIGIASGGLSYFAVLGMLGALARVEREAAVRFLQTGNA